MVQANKGRTAEPQSGKANSRVPLDQAFHLPGHFYSSPEVYTREKERIFLADWICVGRVEEVEKPARLYDVSCSR